MTNEIWKDIEGYEGLYQVSNFGNIKSLSKPRKNGNGKYYIQKEKLLKQSFTSTGYKKVELYKDGKRKGFKVHRLVAIAFIPNPDNKPEVNHIDGNKINNYIENLEWVTQSENVIHAYTTGLNSNKKVLDDKEIIYMYCELNMSMLEIANHFDVSSPTIKKRLEKNDTQIKTLSEQKNVYNLDKIDLDEELKTKSQAELARELGCTRSLINQKLKNKY